MLPSDPPARLSRRVPCISTAGHTECLAPSNQANKSFPSSDTVHACQLPQRNKQHTLLPTASPSLYTPCPTCPACQPALSAGHMVSYHTGRRHHCFPPCYVSASASTGTEAGTRVTSHLAACAVQPKTAQAQAVTPPQLAGRSVQKGPLHWTPR